jgi:cobalt-zinc-cadmium efflux system outer membrane protein
MRTTAGPLLFALLVARSAGGEPAVLTLERVLTDVRTRHPQLRADTARAAADRERITQSTAWVDPVAGLELQRDGSNRLLSYGHAEFQLTQKIPLPGNRESRRALATAEAAVSAASVRSREFLLVAEARENFFALLHAREQLALLRETDRVLAQAGDIVRGRLATGTAGLGTLFAAEAERAQLRERALAFEREAAEAASRLNTLRDLPAQTPVEELALPALTATFASLEDAQARALAGRPELREAEARIAVAARARDLAARASRPEPEVMLRARHANGSGQVFDGYDTGVAISVPWLNRDKYRSAQREADHRRAAAELDAAALRTRTAAEIRDAWQRLQTARENLVLYREHLLPLAARAVEGSRASLIASPSGLLDLVGAEKNLRTAQAALAAHLADYHRAAALLETLAGSD